MYDKSLQQSEHASDEEAEQARQGEATGCVDDSEALQLVEALRQSEHPSNVEAEQTRRDDAAGCVNDEEALQLVEAL